MSAFVVSESHIDYIVRAACTYNVRSRWIKYDGQTVEFTNADKIGAALIAENIASVMYRYPDCALDGLPGPIPTPSAIDYEMPVFGPQPKAVQVLKAISCYEYQSCEHPGWKTSAAKAFCEDLRTGAISHLPGYEEAEWEVDYERDASRVIRIA